MTTIYSHGAKCSDKHPKLNVGTDESPLYVTGGSVTQPVSGQFEDHDIVVALESGGRILNLTAPWSGTTAFYFPIVDMSTPAFEDLEKLITYLSEALQDGKSVMIGCIGGHGRTGLVLAALVATLRGEKDAITYVRKHYCKKAVESSSQINFLVKHYGVTKVEASKQHGMGDYKGVGGKKNPGYYGYAKNKDLFGSSGGRKVPDTIAHVNNPNTLTKGLTKA